MHKKDFQQTIIPLADKVYRLAYRLVEDPYEAEDIVQDVFLKLWDMRKKLSSIENIEAFTMSMTKRVGIDKLRHKKIKLKHAPSIRLELLNNGNEREDHNEVFKEINHTINNLPTTQKQIVVLRDVEGFSYEEIANITGLTVNNLRVSLSRIRKSIKEVVKKKFDYGLRKNQ